MAGLKAKIFHSESELPPGWFLHRFGKGKRLLISVKDGLVLGKSSLKDSTCVSHKHARFAVLEGDRILVQDLDSTNGTFVNGHRVQTKGAVLEDCDLVCFGMPTPKNSRCYGFLLRYKEPSVGTTDAGCENTEKFENPIDTPPQVEERDDKPLKIEENNSQMQKQVIPEVIVISDDEETGEEGYDSDLTVYFKPSPKSTCAKSVSTKADAVAENAITRPANAERKHGEAKRSASKARNVAGNNAQVANLAETRHELKRSRGSVAKESAKTPAPGRSDFEKGPRRDPNVGDDKQCSDLEKSFESCIVISDDEVEKDYLHERLMSKPTPENTDAGVIRKKNPATPRAPAKEVPFNLEEYQWRSESPPPVYSSPIQSLVLASSPKRPFMKKVPRNNYSVVGVPSARKRGRPPGSKTRSPLERVRLSSNSDIVAEVSLNVRMKKRRSATPGEYQPYLSFKGSLDPRSTKRQPSLSGFRGTNHKSKYLDETLEASASKRLPSVSGIERVEHGTSKRPKIVSGKRHPSQGDSLKPNCKDR